MISSVMRFLDPAQIRLAKLFGCLLILFFMVGCQDSNMTDLKQFVASAYRDKKPDIEPLPEIAPYKGFEYAAGDEQDPFNSDNIITDRPDNVAVGDSPDADRRREELERYPLDALRMVGTLIRAQTPYVIVQTSDGTAHRAAVGNYMGQNDGRIKEILPQEQKIVLAEMVIDPVGRWVTREVEITIDE
jgi:type IV pilus assembly protein PilP